MEAVRQATLKDYEEMVRLGNLCFTNPYNQYGVIEQRWCHAWGGHQKGSSEDYIKNFSLIERDQRIVGMIALIPMSLEWKSSPIPTGGITAVATHPDYRNTGVMSTLMSFAEKKMHREPYVISVLGGDRRRYGHFGWEQVGLRGEMLYGERYLHGLPDSEQLPIQIYPEHDSYIERVVRMNARAEMKFARTTDQLKVLLMRPRVEFWAYRRGDNLSSYIAASDNLVWEYQGVPAEIPSLIRYFGISHGYREVRVATPSVFNAHEEQLYKWAASFELKPMVFLKILRFKDLIDKLVPGILERARMKKISNFKITLVLQETAQAISETLGWKPSDAEEGVQS